MKRVILTLELTLGDLPDEERREIAEMTGEKVSNIPHLQSYSDGEIQLNLTEIFGEFAADPETVSEMFAGTDFYATIAKSRVLACTVESDDGQG